MYIKILSRGFCSKVKIAASRPFGTPPYFAGNLRSTGISQLRAGKTRSKKSSTPPFHIHNLKPECARIPRVLAPKKIPVENFRVWSDLRKISVFFSRISIATCKKNLSACWGLNIDATNLPNSQFEPIYPEVFRGSLIIDLVSTVWSLGLPKVR